MVGQNEMAVRGAAAEAERLNVNILHLAYFRNSEQKVCGNVGKTSMWYLCPWETFRERWLCFRVWWQYLWMPNKLLRPLLSALLKRAGCEPKSKDGRRGRLYSNVCHCKQSKAMWVVEQYVKTYFPRFC